jgi:hypothetical protein
MWRFLRLVLAFLVAFIIAVILGTLLLTLSFTGAVVALSQKQKPIIALPDSSWLYIPLTGELREYQRDDLETPSFSVLSLAFSEPKASVPTLEELRRALEAAAENKKIRGIVLYAGALGANPAQSPADWPVAARFPEKKPETYPHLRRVLHREDLLSGGAGR